MKIDREEAKQFLVREITVFSKAVKKTRLEKITRKKIIFELITNAVAALVSILVTKLLHSFIIERSIKNLWGLTARDRFTVSKSTFEFLSWVVVFGVGLIVFTVVERVMENYLEEREK